MYTGGVTCYSLPLIYHLGVKTFIKGAPSFLKMDLLYRVRFKYSPKKTIGSQLIRLVSNNGDSIHTKLALLSDKVEELYGKERAKRISKDLSKPVSRYPYLIPSPVSLPRLVGPRIEGQGEEPNPTLEFNLFCSNPHQYDSYGYLLNMATTSQDGLMGTFSTSAYRYASFSVSIPTSDTGMAFLDEFIDGVKTTYGARHVVQRRPVMVDGIGGKTSQVVTFSGNPWSVYNSHRAFERVLDRYNDLQSIIELDDIEYQQDLPVLHLKIIGGGFFRNLYKPSLKLSSRRWEE